MGREISMLVVSSFVSSFGCDRMGVATANIVVVIAVKVISDRTANFLMTQYIASKRWILALATMENHILL